ncbi:sigma-54-dependent transcriptional regulator [Ferrimonas lipolytica]|uniref:Sigma-54-dependent Fis family transcriptional regulator n=1 Tax=Ferrimonas lipolytica TaxID=2724191 RepID=A0A6H1UEV1_9GAMM|nr:sigma-54 dependent transcriptional regulator [Ferrimonas lipolytica]QIZ77358.1 sigma-54-dependent Fis family transcriptional regulator [Ferrimonas lipolytica]
MSNGTILVVEDDLGLREALVDTLLLGGFRCIEASDGASALVQLNQNPIDMVISDVQMAGMDGLTLLKNLRAKDCQLPILLMTAYGSIDAAVEAMRYGATDYLSKPFAPQVLLDQISRYMRAQPVETDQPVVGDPSSKQLLTLAARVAQSDASVMVLGPSGSGKEVLARYIHNRSKRSGAAFVAINCAAIPDNMLEATLFGYDKGAFTGAVQACPGKFEQAQGGTILLDEITEMDLNLQAKLLRVLQEREVERLGSRKTIRLDVRVLATSNRDLRLAVEQGRFREDLYYRLNVFPLTWPSLAQRSGDILPLANHLLGRHASRSGLPQPIIAACAVERLSCHSWPGNVRELDNVMQRAMILCNGERLTAADLFIDGEAFSSPIVNNPIAAEAMVEAPRVATQAKDLSSDLKHQEFQIIQDALKTLGGSRKGVAEKLGLSPRTLRYKMAKMRDEGYEIPA